VLAGYKGDLHCHTFHSDADGSPETLHAQERQAGLDFLAVADHNTITQRQYFYPASSPDLVFVRGIEVSTSAATLESRPPNGVEAGAGCAIGTLKIGCGRPALPGDIIAKLEAHGVEGGVALAVWHLEAFGGELAHLDTEALVDFSPGTSLLT
jgi:hypothetical protein